MGNARAKADGITRRSRLNDNSSSRSEDSCNTQAGIERKACEDKSKRRRAVHLARVDGSVVMGVETEERWDKSRASRAGISRARVMAVEDGSEESER